jgi:hypothetical protein
MQGKLSPQPTRASYQFSICKIFDELVDKGYYYHLLSHNSTSLSPRIYGFLSIHPHSFGIGMQVNQVMPVIECVHSEHDAGPAANYLHCASHPRWFTLVRGPSVDVGRVSASSPASPASPASAALPRLRFCQPSLFFYIAPTSPLWRSVLVRGMR